MIEPEPSLHALDPTLLHTFTPTTLHARTMRSTSGGFRYGKQVHPSHMPRRQKRWMTRCGNRCQSANHSCLCGAKDANRPALGRTVCWRILPKTFWRMVRDRMQEVVQVICEEEEEVDKERGKVARLVALHLMQGIRDWK